MRFAVGGKACTAVVMAIAVALMSALLPVRLTFDLTTKHLRSFFTCSGTSRSLLAATCKCRKRPPQFRISYWHFINCHSRLHHILADPPKRPALSSLHGVHAHAAHHCRSPGTRPSTSPSTSPSTAPFTSTSTSTPKHAIELTMLPIATTSESCVIAVAQLSPSARPLTPCAAGSC